MTNFQVIVFVTLYIKCSCTLMYSRNRCVQKLLWKEKKIKLTFFRYTYDSPTFNLIFTRNFFLYIFPISIRVNLKGYTKIMCALRKHSNGFVSNKNCTRIQTVKISFFIKSKILAL